MVKKILILGGVGYLGSMLYTYLKFSCPNVSQVDSVDLEWFGNETGIPNTRCDYRELDRARIREYDVVILVAAHSSVKLCKEDFWGAFHNNVDNFVDLCSKLSSEQRFIYASSSCVYDGYRGVGSGGEEFIFESPPRDMLVYSKLSIDRLAALTDLDFYALRFGSVGGLAPHFRPDLMINSMVLWAMDVGVVKVSNAACNRPILGTGDLARAVEAVILYPKRKPGIYNVASFNDSIGAIGAEVAQLLKVPFKYEYGPPTYNFTMSSDKFERTFDFTFNQDLTKIVKTITDDGHLNTKNIQKRVSIVYSS